MKKTNIVNTDIADNNISIVKFEDSCKSLFSILKKKLLKKLKYLLSSISCLIRK